MTITFSDVALSITTFGSIVIISKAFQEYRNRTRLAISFTYRKSTFAKEGLSPWLDFRITNAGKKPIRINAVLRIPEGLDTFAEAGLLKKQFDPYWGGNRPPIYTTDEIVLARGESSDNGVAFRSKESGSYPFKLNVRYEGGEITREHRVVFPLDMEKIREG